MKFFKSFAAFCMVAVCALTLSSCENQNTVVKTYSLGISRYESSGSGLGTDDLVKIQNYLDSKHCPYTGPEHVVTISESSVEKCDKQAKAQFENLAKNLSYTEVEALGLSASCKFTYSIARLKDDTNADSETLYITEWKYPRE